MEKKIKFYGSINGFDLEQKTVDAVILTFDKPNENRWIAKAGCLDAFIDRLLEAQKGVSAKYEHDEFVLIGKWAVRIEGDKLVGKCSLSDIPFVESTVIPQLEDGTLQGASPTLGLVSGYKDKDGNTVLTEAVIAEVSLVGLPAYLDSNITAFSASVEDLPREDFELDILLLT